MGDTTCLGLPYSVERDAMAQSLAPPTPPAPICAHEAVSLPALQKASLPQASMVIAQAMYRIRTAWLENISNLEG